jgi:hypothetical protein
VKAKLEKEKAAGKVAPATATNAAADIAPKKASQKK